MKDKENKELITHIAETLREHEASYKEGAWERFAAKNQRHKRVLPIWYLSGAAAILLLSVGIFLYKVGNDVTNMPKEIAYQQTPQSEDEQISPEKKVDDQLATENDKPIDTDKKIRHNTHQLALNASSAITGEKIENKTENILLQSADRNVGTDQLDKSDDVKQSEEKIAGADANGAVKTQQRNGEDALIRMLSESSNTVGEDIKMANKHSIMDKRWDIGVVLAPSVTDRRFNMGGGVAIAYHISKKVSIGSGVSVVDLGLRQGPPQSNQNALASPAMLNSESPVLSAKSSETKELTSVNTNWLALDVPIDIKYHISKQFYASAGVSFFAVLNENRTNNYITHTPTNRTVQNAEGYSFAQQEFEVKNVSEKTDETPFEGNSYSGFLNFSVGRKVPLSKRVGVSVEPFFKLPIGKLSREDMNLRYGGVRIITDF